MIKRKKCFYCRRKLPLLLFNVNNCTYQVKADLGRTVSCRLCSFKRGLKLGGVMTREEGRFVFKEANIVELAKKFLIGK
jgi:hypothetical protein